MKDGEGSQEPQERDGLDEWVDELDRLIGVEEMTEEEVRAAQAAQNEQKRGIDITLVIVTAIIVLIVIAALLFFRLL